MSDMPSQQPVESPSPGGQTQGAVVPPMCVECKVNGFTSVMTVQECSDNKGTEMSKRFPCDSSAAQEARSRLANLQPRA